MKTDNELIAEFMGGTYFDIGMDNRGYRNLPIPTSQIIISETCSKYIDELSYHKSWDWLMPVVEKIEEEVSKPGQSGVVGWYFWNDTFDGQVFTDIQKTYQFVVEFIKWHNNVSPDKKQ